MASILQLSSPILNPVATKNSLLALFHNQTLSNLSRNRKCLRYAIRVSLTEQQVQPKSDAYVQHLVKFLYEDFPHLCDDDHDVDWTVYDDCVTFRDPITKHDTIAGYLFNLALLKLLFRSECQVHWVKQTGPYEMIARWTAVMTYFRLPWKPELVFTGTSVMQINPDTRKFCSHVDYWDSVTANKYISLEGLWDVWRQLRIYKTPDFDTPKYKVLKRTADYEIRKYDPFIVVEAKGDKISGSTGLGVVVRYTVGENLTQVMSRTIDTKVSGAVIEIVVPQANDMSRINIKKVGGGIAASLKFSQKPVESNVRKKERVLRDCLLSDGLRPRQGCLLALYNNPDKTWEFLMRNEVLIWLDDFRMD